MPTDFASMLRAEQRSTGTVPQSPPRIDFASMLRAPPAAAPASSIEQAAQSVTNEMGTGERLLVGLGRGLDSAWQGVKQLGLEAGGALGFDTKQALADQAAQEADNKRIFDAGVGRTGAGMAGAVIGE